MERSGSITYNNQVKVNMKSTTLVDKYTTSHTNPCYEKRNLKQYLVKCEALQPSHIELTRGVLQKEKDVTFRQGYH